MSYCRQFSQFNPLTGAVPFIPYPVLREIAGRARHIVDGATIEQLSEVAETIEWIIDCAVAEAQEHATDNDSEPPQRWQRSDAQWLRDRLFYYDIRPDPGGKFPHHYHCFAVLALWKVADANFSIQPELDKDGRHAAIVPIDSDVVMQWTAAGRYTVDAMEAVCLAEELAGRHAEDRLLRALFPNEGSTDGATEAIIKKRISVRARAAAIQKHTNNRAARLRAIELYKARNYPSVDAASQAIALLVCKAPRTVAKWIYDERKGRTPSPDPAE